MRILHLHALFFPLVQHGMGIISPTAKEATTKKHTILESIRIVQMVYLDVPEWFKNINSYT